MGFLSTMSRTQNDVSLTETIRKICKSKANRIEQLLHVNLHALQDMLHFEHSN